MFSWFIQKKSHKRRTITNRPKRTRKDYILKKMPHVACSQVEVKLATVQRAEKATLALSLHGQKSAIK